MCEKLGKRGTHALIFDGLVLYFNTLNADTLYPQAALESNERISEQDMYALAHSNLQELLGIRELDEDSEATDLVAYEGGGVFDISSKVIAVISAKRELVDFF